MEAKKKDEVHIAEGKIEKTEKGQFKIIKCLWIKKKDTPCTVDIELSDLRDIHKFCTPCLLGQLLELSNKGGIIE